MHGVSECPFCARVAAGADIIHARAAAVAFPDDFPVSEGHVLVVPRQHLARVEDLEAGEWSEVFGLVREVCLELSMRKGVDGVNVGVNSGVAAGQTVDHAHVHIIPRRLGDVPDPRGGVRHVIPERVGLLDPAMTEALALGEKLLSLLEESARTTTYKPALLLALIDRAQEYSEQESIPVGALAERVVELYWPQTLPYPTTGNVVRQSQTSTGRAAIVQAILAFRGQHGAAARVLPPAIRQERGWEQLVTRVEETLAELPIPRLQRPYEPFLYSFDWDWADVGGWSVRAYRTSGRAITLYPGVSDALTALGPLLRPFIRRWWTDKAAQLNPDVEAARSARVRGLSIRPRPCRAQTRGGGIGRPAERELLLLPYSDQA